MYELNKKRVKLGGGGGGGGEGSTCFQLTQIRAVLMYDVPFQLLGVIECVYL